MKILLSLLLSIYLIEAVGQCPKLPQQVNAYYEWWGGKFKNIVQLPRVAPLASCVDTGMVYYNPVDSNLYGWTGNALRCLTCDITAANNGLFDSARTVQMGEPLNQSGSPNRFNSSREFNMNGFTNRYYDSLNSSVTKSFFSIWDTSGGNTFPGKIRVNQTSGYFNTYLPVNYGVPYNSFYKPGIQKAGSVTTGYGQFVSGDAMPNNVYQIWAYNIRLNSAQIDTSEAGVRIGMETNFLNTIGGSPHLNFEYHNPAVTTFNGTEWRTNSYYVNKDNANCLNQQFIDAQELRSVFAPSFGYHALQWTGAGTLESFTTNDTTQFSGAQIKFTNTQNSKTNYIATQNGAMYFGSDAQVIHSIFDRSGNVWLNQDFSLLNQSNTSTVIGIGASGGGQSAAPSAILDVRGNAKGVLLTRMTTLERLAITADEGLIVYDLTLHQYLYFNGTIWVNF